MMGNYDGLYLPMMVLGYAFSVPFFMLTVRTSQKQGQKASLMKYVSRGVPLLHRRAGACCCSGARAMRSPCPSWARTACPSTCTPSCSSLFFGIGYGAYYATADMPIPMVADCSDYETYRSGNYIPGIMGTLFSLVDKLVSSLSATVVGIAVSFIGLESLPTQYDPLHPRHEPWWSSCCSASSPWWHGLPPSSP